MSLTEDHRRLQQAVAARTINRLADAWVLFDPEDPTTIRRWLDQAVLIIADGHGRSAALARAYYRQFRLLRIGAAGLGSLPEPGFIAEAARTRLIVTGPVAFERARRRGADAGDAYDRALVNAARVGADVALDGGRETITQAVSRDPRARGWIRVTGGNPCDFCVMQASRGAVYSAETVDFASHANCACEPEPAF